MHVEDRAAWGKSQDGIPALCTYIYGGPAKSEAFMQKLPRALTRKATFAGGNYAKIHVKVDHDETGIASYETAAIFHSKEKYMLLGRYFVPSAAPPDKLVILFSGSGGVAAQYLGKVTHRYLKRVGTAVLLMDYRGFGNSDAKTPSEQGLFVDAEAMFKFATDDEICGGLGYSPNKVVIHGYSLGTGVAAEMAARHPAIGGLVLQCPFTSATDMARQAAGSAGAYFAKRGAPFEVKAKLSAVKRPILVLIANQDAEMKSHGDEIERDLAAGLPNLTVGRYDGEHIQPENAFKDGSGKTVVLGSTGTGRVLNSQVRNPVPGEQILKNPGNMNTTGNVKTSTGVGCINTITTWFASL